jgi:hypothetical protein
MTLKIGDRVVYYSREATIINLNEKYIFLSNGDIVGKGNVMRIPEQLELEDYINNLKEK